MFDPIEILLADCNSYDAGQLKSCLDTIGVHFKLPGNLHGQKVLLKPNLISTRGSILACTNGILLSVVAQWFIDHGATVSIGDSPAFGNAQQVMEKRGISKILAGMRVSVVNFSNPVQQDLSHGVRIGVAREALECDLFVNLPKVKAHSQMYVTLAVKNLFGIVVGMRKAMAHMKNGTSHEKFADLMLDLVELLPPGLCIADGITVMHRTGPVTGDPLELGCLAASVDPVALDTCLLDVLELNPQNCPVFRAAQKRRLVGSDAKNLLYHGYKPGHFHGSGFMAPSLLNPVPFNPLRFLVSSMKRAFGAVCA